MISTAVPKQFLCILVTDHQVIHRFTPEMKSFLQLKGASCFPFIVCSCICVHEHRFPKSSGIVVSDQLERKQKDSPENHVALP